MRRLVRRVVLVALLAGGIGLAIASPASAGWANAGLEDSLGQCQTQGEMGVLYGEWLDFRCEGPFWHETYWLWVLYP